MKQAGLAVVLLASFALAQGEKGSLDHISGTVQRKDGSAWGDVSVVLNSLSWRLPQDAGFAERVDSAAGEDGLFRSDVVFGRTYSAWAVSEVEDGRYTISDVVEGISAGQEAELKERGGAQRVVGVEVLGLEEWEGDGPFSYEAVCVIGNRIAVECQVTEAGWALIPPMPDSALFRVRAANGAVIASGMIPLGERERSKAAQRSAGSPSSTERSTQASFVTVSEELTRITVRPPVELHFEVRGPKGSMKGARFYWFDRADRRLLVETDRKGRATLRVPSEWSGRGAPFLSYTSLWVEAPGCASVHWFTEELDTSEDDGKPRVHSIKLPKGYLIEGRLLWARGQPAKQAPILVHTGVPGGTLFADERATFDRTPRIFWTDAKGGFELEGLSRHIGWQLSTFLESGVEVSASPDFPSAPQVVLASGEDLSKKKLDLGKLTLSSFRPVDVTIQDRKGGPSACRSLGYRDELSALMQEENVAQTRTDLRGRVRLLARPKSRFLLSLLNDSGQRQGPTKAVEATTGKKPIEVTLSGADR